MTIVRREELAMDYRSNAEELLRRAEQELDQSGRDGQRSGGVLDFVYTKWVDANVENRVLYCFGLAFALVVFGLIPCVMVWPYITNPATHYSYNNGQLELHFLRSGREAVTTEATTTQIFANGEVQFTLHEIVDGWGNKVEMQVSADGTPVSVQWNGKAIPVKKE